MYRSEVEEWLYSIGLPELYVYFEEDGFNTLDKVRRMRQSDIDAIVDRNGYMIILNEEIDRLNYAEPISYTSSALNNASNNGTSYERASRAGSYMDSEPEFETRESIIARYEIGGIPAVGFASRHLARRAKSKCRKVRGVSVAGRSSPERYVPNSASKAYEQMFAAKRAASVAAASIREAEHAAASAALVERQRKREEERQRRARTGIFRN